MYMVFGNVPWECVHGSWHRCRAWPITSRQPLCCGTTTVWWAKAQYDAIGVHVRYGLHFWGTLGVTKRSIRCRLWSFVSNFIVFCAHHGRFRENFDSRDIYRKFRIQFRKTYAWANTSPKRIQKILGLFEGQRGCFHTGSHGVARSLYTSMYQPITARGEPELMDGGSTSKYS